MVNVAFNIPLPIKYAKSDASKHLTSSVTVHKERSYLTFDKEGAQRIFNMAVSFIKLHKDAGPLVEVAEKAYEIGETFHDFIKTFSIDPDLSQRRVSINSETYKRLQLFASFSFQTGVLCLSFFNERAALLIETTYSVGKASYSTCIHLYEGNTKEGLESLAKCIGNSLYLTAQIVGGVEITTASLAFKVLMTLYASAKDIMKNQEEKNDVTIRLEAIVLLALGVIDAKKTEPHYNQLAAKYQIDLTKAYTEIRNLLPF